MVRNWFWIATFILGLVSPPALATTTKAEPTLRAEWKPAFQAVYQTLDENLSSPDSKFPYYHVHPSPIYKGVYLWDSAFISLVWMKRDLQIAKDAIRSLLHYQTAEGRISHVVEEQATDPWSNPPLIAWAAAKIAAESGDAQFAREIYPKLVWFHKWIWKERRLKNGLFFWLHPYESGIDNSPRFGARDESWYDDTTKIAAVDLSSFAVLDCEALIRLAEIQKNAFPEQTRSLQRDIDIFRAQAAAIVDLMRKELWDDETGYFYDRRVGEADKKGALIRIPTIASIFPLTAGVATPEQAKKLIEHVRSPKEFNTKIPFPTVARSDVNFDKDCWRGPVWVNTAYLALDGLRRYHEDALADEMSFKLVDGVYATWKNTGKLVEFYDPDRFDFDELSRKRGTGLFGFFSASKDPVKFLRHLFLKQLYLGRKPVDHFVGWTGLVNNLALDLDRPKAK